MEKYYIQIGSAPEQEVSKEDFIETERSCGFRSKFGPDHVATGGFGHGNIKGRVEYVK